MVSRKLQKASQSRVFTIEDRAGPNHSPIYQLLARITGVAQALGDVTPIRIADPSQYGQYITVDKITGQKGLPTTTLEFRSTRDASDMLRLIRKGCPIDIQAHIGACKDPSDFDAGWEKILNFDEASFTNYSTGEMGAFDADQEAVIMETLAVTALDMYEILPLTFEEQASSQIVQDVVGVVICDTKSCGVCGPSSDGCQHVYAVQVPAGASPGLPSEVVATPDGGATWVESIVTSLPANRAPSAIGCVGPYIVIVSNADCSLHYALKADILAGTATWTEITTGLVCAAGAPNDIFSLGRTATWVVGDGGYVYKATDITAGVTAQLSGSVTSQDLGTIHGIDEDNLIAGGASNALIVTRNGGLTWAAVTAPAGQAAVTINAVWMMSELEWYIGYNDGKLYYTIDGGANWTQKTVPGSLTVIDDIVFATRTVGYIAGHTASVAKVLRTISGGNTWYALPEALGYSLPSATEFHDLAACGENPNVVWAAGIKTVAGDGILIKGE